MLNCCWHSVVQDSRCFSPVFLLSFPAKCGSSLEVWPVQFVWVFIQVYHFRQREMIPLLFIYHLWAFMSFSSCSCFPHYESCHGLATLGRQAVDCDCGSTSTYVTRTEWYVHNSKPILSLPDLQLKQYMWKSCS